MSGSYVRIPFEVGTFAKVRIDGLLAGLKILVPPLKFCIELAASEKNFKSAALVTVGAGIFKSAEPILNIKRAHNASPTTPPMATRGALTPLSPVLLQGKHLGKWFAG